MSKVTAVANVQEAVELAQTFKAEGRYNWFRGQLRDWSPVSSLYRLATGHDNAAVKRAVTRYELFRKWLEENADLRHLVESGNEHGFFAVAQHYGIPTNHIDFTTDPAVAGFFASDTKTPPEDGVSCIYCLDTRSLRDFSKSLKIAGREELIEIVEVDVTNLWRLQAQKGVFVYSNCNWDIDYPLDRIVFPYTGYPSYPPADSIYPKDKSALELRLDQYFDVESKHFAQEYFIEMLASVPANRSFYHMESHEGGFYAEAFVNPGIVAPLPSWSDARDSKWHAYPDEHFQDVGSHVERIRMNGTDRPSIERAVMFGVKQALDAKPENRAKLVEWRLEGATNDWPHERIDPLFRYAWNGMRSHPFSNAQIAAAFSAIAGLVSIGFGISRDETVNQLRFSEIRGDAFCVEIAYADNSSSIGFATPEALRSAMRSDFKSLVFPRYHDRLDDLTLVLQLIQNPSLLFEFEPMVDIFARDLIPSQIVLGRMPTLFNPAAITVLGLP